MLFSIMKFSMINVRGKYNILLIQARTYSHSQCKQPSSIPNLRSFYAQKYHSQQTLRKSILFTKQNHPCRKLFIFHNSVSNCQTLVTKCTMLTHECHRYSLRICYIGLSWKAVPQIIVLSRNQHSQ